MYKDTKVGDDVSTKSNFRTNTTTTSDASENGQNMKTVKEENAKLKNEIEKLKNELEVVRYHTCTSGWSKLYVRAIHRTTV